MTILSQETTLLSRDFTHKARLMAYVVKSFASKFIPVFWDAKTKHGRFVTSTLCFTPTCSDEEISKLDYPSPSLFLSVKYNNSFFPA